MYVYSSPHCAYDVEVWEGQRFAPSLNVVLRTCTRDTHTHTRTWDMHRTCTRDTHMTHINKTRDVCVRVCAHAHLSSQRGQKLLHGIGWYKYMPYCSWTFQEAAFIYSKQYLKCIHYINLQLCNSLGNKHDKFIDVQYCFHITLVWYCDMDKK